jgi:putative endonuclease
VTGAVVYLLRCGDGSLYCGWTNDLERRLRAHERGTGSRYTRRRLPVEVAASWAVEDRSEALRTEAALKRLSRREKLALVAAEDDGAPLAVRLGVRPVASAG